MKIIFMIILAVVFAYSLFMFLKLMLKKEKSNLVDSYLQEFLTLNDRFNYVLNNSSSFKEVSSSELPSYIFHHLETTIRYISEKSRHYGYLDTLYIYHSLLNLKKFTVGQSYGNYSLSFYLKGYWKSIMVIKRGSDYFFYYNTEYDPILLSGKDYEISLDLFE